MIIVIDAYNMLRSTPPHGRKVTEPERERFIAQIGRYGRIKDHKMVVVFDGGPVEWTFKERKNGVSVVYAGHHESADDVIKRYLGEQKTRDILLVSSDHELRERASRLSFPSIGSFHFYQIMVEVLQEKGEVQIVTGQVVKTKKKENTDLDALMEESSRVIPIKTQDLPKAPEIKRKGKRSREERRLEKILKKL